MNRQIIIFFLAIAAWVAWDGFYVIQEGRLAIVTRFGEYRYSVHEPGLYFKTPMADTVTQMERRILGSDTPPAEYLTLDKKRLVADPITRWRIVNPLAFFKTVRDESGAKARIDDIVNSELRGQLAKRDFGEIIGEKRESLVREVAAAARKQVDKFGIELVDVRIKRADLPEEVQESVFQRMRAERDRIAKRYRSEGEEEAAKIKAQTNKERSILLAKAYETAQITSGEGDAASIAIYAEAYSKDSEFYTFNRSLEAYETAIDPKTQVVLSTDNDLLRYVDRTR